MITAKDYENASGSSPSRRVKSKIYAAAKATGDVAAVVASATALPKDSGNVARKAGLVPENAGYNAPSAPINNMGENLQTTASGQNWEPVCDEDMGQVEIVVTSSGKTKIVPIRRPSRAQACIIDWVNFTVLEDTFLKTARNTIVSDEQVIAEASRQLEIIFGFGITEKRDRGMNFYRDSWVLGDSFGFVCFGGQRQTLLVTLSGQGCQNALFGWEKRLFDFLKNTAVRPSISRCDLAYDDIEGKLLSVDWAERQWFDNGFTFSAGGRPPNIERVGNWHKPSGKGRTLTIGTRTSSKFCRFYEKGKKEGDKDSLWCRCEVEFKNANMLISLEILLTPTDFFLGAYPCFSHFAETSTPQRFAVKKKAAEITIAACVAVTKHQFGKYLRVFRELWGDQAALDAVCNADEDYWPRRMKPLTSSASTGSAPVHKQDDFGISKSSFDPFYCNRPLTRPQGDYGFA